MAVLIRAALGPKVHFFSQSLEYNGHINLAQIWLQRHQKTVAFYLRRYNSVLSWINVNTPGQNPWEYFFLNTTINQKKPTTTQTIWTLTLEPSLVCPLPFYSWQFNHIWHLVEEQSCFCLPTINNDNISDGTAITYSDLEPSTKEMKWSSLKEHGGTLKNYQL